MPIIEGNEINTTGLLQTVANGAGRYKRKIWTERCTATGYTPSITVSHALPAGARLIFASMKPATALDFLIGSSAAQTTAGQVGVAMVIGTAPTSLTTNATTANFVFLTAESANGAGIAINQDPINAWSGTPAATNGLIPATTLNLPNTLNGSAARTVYLVPYAATTAAEAAQRFQVATGTAATVATTGYVFNTSTSASCSIDVQMVYEILDETPDA